MALLRIGSRGSQLALWQANHVRQLLEARGHECTVSIIRTTGDKVLDVPLAQVGTKGMFTKEIEEALIAGEIDLAVHSLKDLPTELAPEFALAAILPREDARDAFLSQKFADVAALPKGARVGTSSLRRQAQLHALRPDVETVPLRGNVDTRLKRLASGDFDAIILAASGLKRLGREKDVRSYLPVEQMCPAAGQGALAIEVRSADAATRKHLAPLDDIAARATTLCERMVLNGLGGGCQVPIGAHAMMKERTLSVQAVVAMPDGSRMLRESQQGSDPIALGEAVARALLERGAREILEAVYATGAIAPEQP